MARVLNAVVLFAALGAAACSGPDRFGSGFGDDGLTTDPSFGAGGELGSIDDPTSIAYFQQAVGDRVLFAVDQSTLSSEAEALLASQANWMASNPDYTAIIEGHADEQGTREYNLALGERRAAAVQTYLISLGVAPGRLQTVTYGKERPIEICSDERCYSQNRRAVTVLAAGFSG